MIANSNSAVTCSISDLARGLDMNAGGHMFGRFLKVELTGKINDNIANEDKKQGYSEVENSSFNAKFCQIVNNQSQIEDFDYPGTIVLNLDIRAMGISLPDPSPDKNRFFYTAHNYKDASVEYLPLSVSSDKLKRTVSVSSLSPFAIVYKDAKRPEPSSPSYKPPKTGN